MSDPNKKTWTWQTPRLPEPARVVRWGHFGTPVLLYPTAGGDFEEVERFKLIHVLGDLISQGRIKVYSIDSVAGKTWLKGTDSPEYCSKVQNLFDAYIYEEVVPLIRQDCASPDIEVIATGASIGAFNAVASICRHPDAFKLAIAMSYLPGLADDHPQMAQLRQRFVLLPTGEGDYEDPGESWRVAKLLGARGVPNRVDSWGADHHHNWNTWRAMLPKYLAEMA
jgi:esterase/lipase superfamily enzyme